MLVEAQIPAISRGVAVEEIRKYLLDPKEAVRETTQRMEDENPHLLGHFIIGDLGVMQSFGERAALVNLKGGLYYYQCYSQEATQGGIPIISVRRETVRSIFERNAADFSTFTNTQDETVRMQYLKEANDQLRDFTTDLENNNPYLLACAKGFEIEEKAKEYSLSISVPQLLQGGMFSIHDALRQESNSSPSKDLSEEQKPNSALLPAIRGESVRESLIEIILDRNEFTQTSLGCLRQYCPDWTNALDKTEYTTPFTKTEYELFVSLVVGSYFREFSRRNITFPPVSLDRIKNTLGITIKDGQVVEAPEPKLRIGLAYDTLAEMESENVHLFRAYSTLVLGRNLGDYFNSLSQAALFALTDSYRLIKAQAEAEYWEKQFAKS